MLTIPSCIHSACDPPTHSLSGDLQAPRPRHTVGSVPGLSLQTQGPGSQWSHSSQTQMTRALLSSSVLLFLTFSSSSLPFSTLHFYSFCPLSSPSLNSPPVLTCTEVQVGTHLSCFSMGQALHSPTPLWLVFFHSKDCLRACSVSLGLAQAGL